MSTKKKLLIAIGAMSIIVIGLIVAITLVLVASAAQSTASMTVTYKVTSVSAEISANYAINNVINPMYTEDGATILVLSPSGNDTGSLYPSDDNGASAKNLTFTKDETNGNRARIVFEYVFKNLSSENAMNINLASAPEIPTTEPVEDKEATNVRITAYSSLEQLDVATYTTIEEQEDAYKLYESAKNVDDFATVACPSLTTAYVYIVVEVQNLLYDASYIGNVEWSLTLANAE